VVASLIESPGVGGHVHFDDPEFDGLVPGFTDVAWLDIARDAAWVASRFNTRVVDVPLGSWPQLPSPFRIDHLTRLEPWVPPGLYVLTGDFSAYDQRLQSGSHSDDIENVQGAKGWLGAHLDAEPDPHVWRVSLMLETNA
jgi:hypothetical protein